MDENKSFIVMIILVVVAFIAFTFFMPKQGGGIFQNNSNSTKNETTKKKEDIKETENNNFVENENFGKYELVEIPQEIKYDLTYENDNIKIIFSPYDAIVKNAFVKSNFSKSKKNQSYDLVDGNNETGALRIKFGSWDNEITLSNLTGGKNLYHYKRIGDKFIFTCKFKKIDQNPDDEIDEEIIYSVEKIYEFYDNENVFNLSVNFYNDKNEELNINSSNYAYSIGWGPLLGVDSKEKTLNRRHVSSFSMMKNDKLYNVNGQKKKIKILKQNFFNGMFDIGKEGEIKNLFGNYSNNDEYKWIASNGHYFAAVICPDNNNLYKYFFDYRNANEKKNEDKSYYCGLVKTTDNKSEIKSSFHIFVGPKMVSLNNHNKYLANASKTMVDKFKLPDPKLTILHNVDPIARVIEWALELIYMGIPSYGLAIIILTILIKLILSPLTYKSMQSQQKMSKLQPKLQELQAKYKDDAEQLNKETMKLYKKEGINPLGGCLPMVLQMPILFALYNILNKMVALKGEGFLWIKDLSGPDGQGVFNLPGGFVIPLLNSSSINILPILMVGVQIGSSLLMPGSSSNKQAKMMMWTLPLVFFFMFYNASAGLVIYWTVMNLLNVAQQLIMNLLQNKKITLFKKAN